MPALDDQELVFAAVKKWIFGEPMSYNDMERIIHLLHTRDFTISRPSEDEHQMQAAKLREVLFSKYGPRRQ